MGLGLSAACCAAQGGAALAGPAPRPPPPSLPPHPCPAPFLPLAQQVPKAVSNVPSEVLLPSNCWADKENYTTTLSHLAELFVKVGGGKGGWVWEGVLWRSVASEGSRPLRPPLPAACKWSGGGWRWVPAPAPAAQPPNPRRPSPTQPTQPTLCSLLPLLPPAAELQEV